MANAMGKKATKSRKANEVTLKAQEGQNLEQFKAKTILQPSLHGAVTLQQVNKSTLGELDLMAMVDALKEQSAEIRAGNLGRAESMLMTQASTLDAIFHNLTRRALSAEYMPQLEAFMRLGLKAQAQARATIEALGELKHPRTVQFVGQANIANGPQQVNNEGNVPATAPGTAGGKSGIEPSELLEVTDVERMDTGTADEAGRVDQAMATVGAVNGAANA